MSIFSTSVGPSLIIRFRQLAGFVAMFGMITLLATVSAVAQDGDPVQPLTGGIQIDASGVLSSRTMAHDAQHLNQMRFQEATASLNTDLQKPSDLRKISLTRLEKEVSKLLAEGKPLTEEMNFLAGLNRITHVFYYPETRDVVIAGPAEGFFINADNRAVGMHSGRATVELQDLVVALRAFGPGGHKTRMISCSIDPTQEGLIQMRQAVDYVQRNFRPGDEAAVVRLFRESLGLQTITIEGVSPRTHFARVLVEADYEMKLIGLGLRQPPVRITSFVEKSKPRTVAKNSLQRWYFQPDYQCVHMTQDKRAMHLVGDGVKLVGEDESVTASGDRKQSGGMNAASRAFTTSFTRMYGKLAEQAPLFAELRNLIDMSIAAAFIQKMGIYGDADWNLTTFGDESIMPVETFYAPKHVEPVINAFWKGNAFMTPIGGGVDVQPRVALNSDRITIDETGEIAAVRDEIKVEGLADGQWWWD